LRNTDRPRHCIAVNGGAGGHELPAGLQEHPEWLDGKFIHMPAGSSLKKKMWFKERIIRLSHIGDVLVPQFLRTKRLPTRQAWNKNMKKWAIKAGIDPTGLCAKTTRKTWESWLVYYYPGYITHIFINQGHTDMVSVQHYLNMPFTDNDKQIMRKWVGGWI